MYDTERVQYWVGRSNSPEYLKAYSEIARQVPGGFRGTIIDICCGTGKLIDLISDRAGQADFIGTDSSEEMLSLTKRNLHAKLDNKTRINIIHDDVLNTGLSENIADYVFFTFPETGVGTEITLEEREEMLLTGERVRKEEETHFVANLRANKTLKRVIKPAGLIFTVLYDIIPRTCASSFWKNKISSQRVQAAHSGLILIGGKFYESESIYSDTLGVQSGESWYKEAKKGYSIWKFTKR